MSKTNKTNKTNKTDAPQAEPDNSDEMLLIENRSKGPFAMSIIVEGVKDTLEWGDPYDRIHHPENLSNTVEVSRGDWDLYKDRHGVTINRMIEADELHISRAA